MAAICVACRIEVARMSHILRSMLHVCCMYVACMLHVCMYVACCVHVCRMYIALFFGTCDSYCIYVAFMVAGGLPVACMLHICCVHVACMSHVVRGV